MKLLFFDICCPKPYSLTHLKSEAMGGTEATAVRIAEALGERHVVHVAQKDRAAVDEVSRARYIPLESIDKDYDAVVLLRDPKTVSWANKRFPNSQLFLWCHDENYPALVEAGTILNETGTRIIAVSRYHQTRIYNAFLAQEVPLPTSVCVLYNPVFSLPPRSGDGGEGFLYFSSPHKGLELTLQQFQAIRGEYPTATLRIANPGYMSLDIDKQPGVSVLGSLKHADVLGEIQKSWAVLHCNSVFPETFGLVHAEANAMGVPVITGGLGANREVLSPYKAQVTNIANSEAILSRMLLWQEEYPVVTGKQEFRIDRVLEKWEKLIHGKN